jgi:hypothetical protein
VYHAFLAGRDGIFLDFGLPSSTDTDPISIKVVWVTPDFTLTFAEKPPWRDVQSTADTLHMGRETPHHRCSVGTVTASERLPRNRQKLLTKPAVSLPFLSPAPCLTWCVLLWALSAISS